MGLCIFQWHSRQPPRFSATNPARRAVYPQTKSLLFLILARSRLSQPFPSLFSDTIQPIYAHPSSTCRRVGTRISTPPAHVTGREIIPACGPTPTVVSTCSGDFNLSRKSHEVCLSAYLQRTEQSDGSRLYVAPLTTHMPCTASHKASFLKIRYLIGYCPQLLSLLTTSFLPLHVHSPHLALHTAWMRALYPRKYLWRCMPLSECPSW